MVAGVAVAAAVITGSLLVGDSVSGSIRDTAISRLGRVDHALVAPGYFRAALARELAGAPSLAGRVRRAEALILTRGAAQNARTEATVPGVSVLGIPDAFAAFCDGMPAVRLSERQAILNRALADDLGARAGDTLFLSVDREAAVPSDTLFAHRERAATVRTLRLQVARVLPTGGAGDFRLDASPLTPRNLFVSRDWLAAELGKEGRANALVIESEPGARDGMTEPLRAALASACALADYALRLAPAGRGDSLLLSSERVVLPESQVTAAQRAAADCGARAALTSVSLATTIRRVSGGGEIAYAVIAALEAPSGLRLLQGGGEAPERDGIWLNAWAAADLGARVGERLALETLVPTRDGAYRTRAIPLVLRGVVAMEESGADPALVPEIAGITDAERVDEWSAPFPVDRRRVTPRDEAYWERHRAAPKGFVSLETMRDLWRGDRASDWVTAMRVGRAEPIGRIGPIRRDSTHRGSGAPPRSTLPRAYSAALLGRLKPDDAGLVFRPVRREALAASAGTTDFGQLFLAMSFVLVLSAAGLAGTTLRLMAERRAGQAGILLATGFTERAVLRAVLGEGSALALLGVLAGTPLGVLYAWSILRLLATHWVGAVGTSALWLHVEPASLAAGGLSGLVVGVLAAGWGARALARRRLLDLLAGWRAAGVLPGPGGRRAGALLTAGLLTAACLLGLAAAGRTSATGAFFGGGAALLVAGLSACHLALGRALRVRRPAPSPGLLAVRSAAANRGRSMLVIGLMAAAAFVLVAVAANRRGAAGADPQRRESGTGGFALRAVSSLPVRLDFGTPEGRARLGFPPEEEALYRGVRVVPFLTSPGEDISCLNLARATAPRLLAVPPGMIARGGFRVLAPGASPGENPWRLLDAPPEGGAIPAFGDADSVMWSLHSGPGKVYSVPDEAGRPAALRFVGVLPGSVFGGELLVSEASFRRLFPSVDAPRTFLIETPPGREGKVAESLRRNLGDLGLEVRTTREVLSAFHRVMETYLSTFLALGGLGMLLGTFGLVTALLRAALERRGEMALMLAAGFRRGHLVGLLLVENAVLLLAGVACGVVSALVAVAPALASAAAPTDWRAPGAMIAGMLALGLLSCAAAAHAAVGDQVAAALQQE